MFDELIDSVRSANRSWSRMATGLLRGQWALVDTGFRTADKLLGAAAEPAAPQDMAAQPAVNLGTLLSYSLERVRKGKPPPRELYDVKYREQIDWLRFPAWARPSDPEAFVGCSHEG